MIDIISPEIMDRDIEFEGLENISKLSILMGAEAREDDSILFYKQAAIQFPEWEEVLTSIMEDGIRHKGQLQAIRETIDGTNTRLVEEGKAFGERQLSPLFVEDLEESWIDSNSEVSLDGSQISSEEQALTLLNKDNIQY